MKKLIPFAVLGIGILVLAGAILIFRGSKEVPEKEETAPEIPFEMRPVTSLTPSEDGHWLTLKIESIEVEAATMDYELLYTLPDGRTQGVPGTIKIQKGDTVERKLLLGSESSGKFRYDEGVNEGTLTLKFRNEKGKLAGKLATKFHLQSKTSDLTSIDGLFKYTLEGIAQKDFFIVMETFGVSESLPGIIKGPYAVFSSSEKKLAGKVELTGDIYAFWGRKWEKLENGQAENLGIFASVNPQ